MNLWIRSQNRERLIKLSELMIRDDYISNQISYSIATVSNDKTIAHTLINLGTYATKERALEVLNEIQETMCIDKFNYEDKDKSCYQDCYRYKSDIIAVYEMPEE